MIFYASIMIFYASIIFSYSNYKQNLIYLEYSFMSIFLKVS